MAIPESIQTIAEEFIPVSEAEKAGRENLVPILEEKIEIPEMETTDRNPFFGQAADYLPNHEEVRGVPEGKRSETAGNELLLEGYFVY